MSLANNRARYPHFIQYLTACFICFFAAALSWTTAPAQDKIGIYWDDEFTSNTGSTLTVPGAILGYLVLHDASGTGGIQAWEACIEVEGSVTLAGFNFQSEAINVGSGLCFSVGYAAPLLPASDVILATFQAIATEAGASYLSLVPSLNASIPNQMSYIAADTPETLIPMITATGQARVAGINGANLGLTLDMQSLDFGDVALGDSLTTSIRVNNSSQSPATINFDFNNNCASFAFPNGNSPTVVPAASFVDIEVIFVPLVDRQVSCEIVFDFRAESFGLTGTGISPLDRYVLTGDTSWGTLEIGDSQEHIFTLESNGPPSILVHIGFDPPSSDFSITSGGGFQTIASGQILNFSVLFAPTSIGTQNVRITFAYDTVADIDISGAGIIIPAWTAPTEVDFGKTYPNIPAVVTIPITNQSITPMPITATIAEDCQEFTIIEGGDTEILLALGQTHYLTVQLQSGPIDNYLCAMDMGAVVPPISLRGLVNVPRDFVHISPAVLSFPPTIVGKVSETNLFLRNTAGQSLTLDVATLITGPEFSIISGGGPQSVAPGEELMVRVRFTPTTVGFYYSEIAFNPRLRNRSLFAEGIEDTPRCSVKPAALNFGSLIVDSSFPQEVTVTNTTEESLVINPLSTSPDFVFSGSAFTINPGQSSTFSVSMLTAEPGSRAGTLLLGNTRCAPIHLSGTVNYDPSELTASPASVEIPTIQIGTAAEREVTVTNNSAQAIDLNITLLYQSTGFLIVSGGGLQSLPAGESHLVKIRFVGITPTDFSTALSFGNFLVTVPITASAASVVDDCAVSTSEVVFGKVTIGESLTKSLTVSNNSSSDLAIAPTSLSGELELSSSSAIILPGGTTIVFITYSPTQLGTFNAIVSLGNEACLDIDCFGQGLAQEEFDKDFLGVFWDENFLSNNTYNNPTNSLITGYLVLSEASHTGGVSAWEAKIDVVGSALLLSWGLEGDTINLGTDNEYIVGLGTPLPFVSNALLATFTMLNVNGSATTEIHGTPIESTPSIVGQMSWVAADLPSQLLPLHTASGTSVLGSITPSQVVNPSWYRVMPSSIDIPAVLVGTIVDSNIEVANVGPVPILFDVKLLQPTFGFEILSGSGLQVVAPGTSLAILLRFNSPLADFYSTNISLGSGLPLIPVDAIGMDPIRDCEISATAINFGSVNPGAIRSRVFDIMNTTDTPMAITPSSSSAFFVIDNSEVNLAPGQTHTFQVLFQPVAEIHYTTTIDLSNSLCNVVTCVGDGQIGEDFDADLLGIFFDQDYSQSEALSVTNEVLTGYLVMTNPSRAGGVLAWECMVETVGDAVILAWRFEGDYINVGTRDDFVVGLATPLPFTNQALLASFDVLNLGENDATLFFVQPTRIPAVRDQMSWIAASSPETLLPIHTLNNDDLVASITPTSPVAIEIPAPRAQRLGQQVSLSWQVASNLYASSHVYRRLEGQQIVRLTETPLIAHGRNFTYTDITTEIAPGSTLFYSYASIKNGVEETRSAEVEVLLPTVPVLATRLLPNVPNPFNPVTAINFQLNTTGVTSLKIYDVTGRLIRELANGTLAAGPHSRIWQGRDDRGRQVPSGTYYVRLVTRNKVDSRKIMLLK